MKKIPIIIGGKAVGSVELRRQGAYMLCCGQAQWTGEVVRLWLYGQGEPGYLGVLLPEDNGMARVRKKFGMSDFGKLPHPLEYCAPAPIESAKPQAETEERYWTAMPDGTLTCRDNGRRLVAFPAANVRLPRGGGFLLRVIEGKQYVIFPW